MDNIDRFLYRFSIDRGGTFTDIYCEIVERFTKVVLGDCVLKLLSEDPLHYKDAPTEGIRRILEQYTKIPHSITKPLDTSRIDYIRMGTTVATNALLERNGERCVLITTKGFRDLQLIGNQSRSEIFDLEIRRPDNLYDCVVEVDERVCLFAEGSTDIDPADIIIGTSQDKLYVEKPVNEPEVYEQLRDVYEKGIRSVAIVFMHGYTFPHHENMVEKIAKEVGFSQISLSNQVNSMIRIVPRGGTTCVDAYLTPVLKRYLNSFADGFDAGFHQLNISFMQSDGGLTPMDSFFGNKAILSGPAGGVVGYSRTSDNNIPLIGFDMGGTSTDVSRYNGMHEHVFETTTAGVMIQSPQLDINTVAAGGGSRLFFRNGLFVVGPESAGAHPGPVCYRKGGPLTITDANVLLGRIQPRLFPSIFGPNENEELDFDGTLKAFQELTKEINEYFLQNQATSEVPRNFNIDEVAYGFLRVGNEAMTRPIRNLTTMKGYDVTKHTLACFGGAGPQHCCAIAKSLGMSKIVVHKHSGILSAYGLSLADIVVERQEPFNSHPLTDSLDLAEQRLDALESEAIFQLKSQGFTMDNIESIRILNCRYSGTDTSTMITLQRDGTTTLSYAESFVNSYRREYGFELHNRSILIDDIRVRAVGHSDIKNGMKVNSSTEIASKSSKVVEAKEIVSVYFDEKESENHEVNRRFTTPIHYFKDLSAGDEIPGPAMIIQSGATVVVEPNCVASITNSLDIEITILGAVNHKVGTNLDPIYLSIFSHRFMGIAEQMGRTLQRTSISVNIKERLDFSCAVFDGQGGLVANAPHLPVHLGAMSEAVKYQLKHWNQDENGGIQAGDVLVSNHPQLAGGSHLPDITVITPVYEGGKIVFFVACRGHHADVGGIAPGSMPPLSKTLEQEGASIIAFKLVRHGEFQEDGISELLLAPGKIDGNSGARTLKDNMSDLKAQVAANQKGLKLMQQLVKEFGLDVVSAYMGHIQTCAELSVRDMLRKFSSQEGLPPIGTVHAEDYLDDGTCIKLSVTINRNEGSAFFDFSGTGPEVYGNLNAPPAVTSSAIIYCLRCFIPHLDIPLNQGCLTPISIKIPEYSVLHPSSDAAVVGGNVLTSQRVTDVVLLAFKACAASQGCMNNLTFGDSRMGYYETIAGGAGAGPSWHGCSGVHTHMTNTRITDPEILEKRYPVILRQFSLRSGSGGKGMYNGGEGVIRELEFRRPLAVSILSERRSFQPYGLFGGQPGARGENLLTMKAGSCGMDTDGAKFTQYKTVNLGAKNTVQVQNGDRLKICTPGGGGYGLPSIIDGTELPNAPIKAGNYLTSGSLNQYTMDQESA